MLKKHFYRLILLIAIISAVFSIYKQLSVLLNAQTQIGILESKIFVLDQRNQTLKKSLSL